MVHEGVLKQPTEMFPPTGAEAEEADRAALAEVFNLCFDGTSLDDAVNHVVVERDLLRHLLKPSDRFGV